MSDFGDGEEYQYEWPDDDQNDWDNNSDGGGQDDPCIQVENQYYEAEDNMKENPTQAIEQFENCILMEENIGTEVKYRFLALQNIVILSVRLQLTAKIEHNL
jgi:hypothetical protein